METTRVTDKSCYCQTITNNLTHKTQVCQGVWRQEPAGEPGGLNAVGFDSQ